MSAPGPPGGSVVPRLSITTVRAKAFGGWANHGLDLGAAPLVMVSGANSTGKSTLATLIRWLLAGTDGLRTADVTHLGDPGSTLSGSLEGTLGRQPLRIDGAFRIMKQGEVRSTLQVETDSTLDLDAWLDVLGGVDHSIIRDIYSLWGGDLHQSVDIETHFERISMGQVALGNPRSVIADLRARAKASARARSAGDTSMLTLGQEIDHIRGLQREAMQTSSGYVTLQQQIAQLTSVEQQERAACEAAARQVRQIDSAIEATEVQDRIDHLVSERERVGALPEEWLPVLAERSRLVRLDEYLNAAEQAAARARADADDDARAAGITLSRAAELQISDEDVAAIGLLVADIQVAASRLASASEDELVAEAELTASRSSLGDALAFLGHVDERALSMVTLGVAERDSLSDLIRSAQLAAARANERREQMDEVADAVIAAQDRERALEQNWSDLGGEGDPTVWLRSTAPGVPPSTTRSGPPQQRVGGWFAVAALFVVAAFAAADSQWMIASVATLLAALALAAHTIATTGPRASRHPDRAPSTANGARLEVMGGTSTVAIELIAVRDESQKARNALAERRRSLNRATRAAQDELSNLHAAAAARGVNFRGALDAMPAELARWAAAVEAQRRYCVVRRAYSARIAARTTANDDVVAAEQVLTTRLTSAGIGIPQPITAAGDRVHAYRRARDSTARLVAADRALAALREEWDQLLAPAAELAAGWSRSRTLGHLADLDQLAGGLDTLASALNEARIELATHMRDDGTRRLVADRPDRADLAALRERTVEQLTASRDEELSAREQIGSLRTQLSAIEGDESLARLRAELGGLEGQQLDLAVEAAAASLAAALLEKVSQRFQRENQPALLKQTSRLATLVTSDWESVGIRPGVGSSRGRSVGGTELVVNERDGATVAARLLSTGARGLLQLSLRLALADQDRLRRGWSLPLVCDDPFVHFADDWADRAMELLCAESHRRQVIVFTCHSRTTEAARRMGAAVVEL